VLPKLKASQLNKLQVILGGRRINNQTMVRLLFEHIGVGALCAHEDFGMDSSAKEPLAFAILAHETLLSHPNNVPNVTGARRAVVLGKIVPGGQAGGTSYTSPQSIINRRKVRDSCNSSFRTQGFETNSLRARRRSRLNVG